MGPNDVLQVNITEFGTGEFWWVIDWQDRLRRQRLRASNEQEHLTQEAMIELFQEESGFFIQPSCFVEGYLDTWFGV